MDSLLSATLGAQRGVLFGVPAVVHRYTYAGRNVLAPNDDASDSSKTDARGYLPVEWCVLSPYFVKPA